MARYDHLPLWRDAQQLTVLIEEAVRNFPRYHKYAIRADPEIIATGNHTKGDHQ